MSAPTRDDPYNLERFVRAQEACWTSVLSELRAGAKRSHWMWFIFPQVAGLGSSEMAQRYAIPGLAEARAYAAHAVLGARLRECVQILLALTDRTAEDIFGWPDCAKLCSCLTLFERAVPAPDVFAEALARYYRGKRDEATLQRI